MSIRNMMIGGAGATAPDAPTIGTATGGNASASVTFSAPANNGGSAITGFTVTSSPSGITGAGASSPITVSGLSNGTAYTFTVTATNAIGTGAASAASNSVTPSVPATIQFLLVAGGGGGGDGNAPGGAGGAGGLVEGTTTLAQIGGAGTTWAVSVGALGNRANVGDGVGNAGGDSTMGPLTAFGGGRGGGYCCAPSNGGGGSGGGQAGP